jgi:hypothetical protein
MLNYVWIIPKITLVEEFEFNEYTYDPEVLREKCSGPPHTYT